MTELQPLPVADVLVVVTRPQPDAHLWVEALAARGVPALALPLIDIRPARDRSALQAGLARLTNCHAVMFVSAQAVVHAFAAAAAPGGLAPLFQGEHPVRAWATGPGTAQALLQAGVPADCIDSPDEQAAQWDSEALWQQVQPQLASLGAGQHQVLIVRGSDAQGRMAGRDWLAQQLQARGVTVQFAVAYERHLPAWTTAVRAQAVQAVQAQPVPAPGLRPVWVFSSSEAVANLQQLLPDLSWAHTRAVATHGRIAQAARAAGFGVVCESRPGLDAVLASIKSMQ